MIAVSMSSRYLPIECENGEESIVHGRLVLMHSRFHHAGHGLGKRQYDKFLYFRLTLMPKIDIKLNE